MRIAKLLLLLLGGVAVLVGCQRQEIDTKPTNTVEIDGLAVSLDIPHQFLVVGEQFELTVTAHNMTRRPMRIDAETGALVYVRIFRHTGLVWEEVKRYPATAAMIMSPWTLQRTTRRDFVMQMTVEPDWPVGEPLRITAELDGRPDVSPEVIVEVGPPVEPQPQ